MGKKTKAKPLKTLPGKSGMDIRNITPEELEKIRTAPDVQIIDVRGALELLAGGKIEGAGNIPLKNLEKSLARLDAKKKTVVYCRAGHRSQMASDLLVKNGFRKVYNLAGGYLAYKDYKSGK